MNLGNLLVMLVIVTIVTVALDSLLYSKSSISQPVHLYWRISSAFMWSVIVRAAIEQITK